MPFEPARRREQFELADREGLVGGRILAVNAAFAELHRKQARQMEIDEGRDARPPRVGRQDLRQRAEADEVVEHVVRQAHRVDIDDARRVCNGRSRKAAALEQ